jgi:putative acetyltransferase
VKRAAFIARVTTDPGYEDFGLLVREYIASLPFVLDFQDVENELSDLPKLYGPPGGACFLAFDDQAPVGCVGVRRLEDGVAELKRMYVRPSARGNGHGRALCEAAIAAARDLGYAQVRLDTVAEMTTAGEIYRRAGFVPIPPYRENPLESARYYELRLQPGSDEDERAN